MDRLGLRQQSLTERGVSREEIPKIVQRAIAGGEGLREGETYDGVVRLVEGFF